jgi:hypothetical protein
MIYKGNYYDWIDQNWINLVLSKDGQARPRDWDPAYAVESSEYKQAQSAGYDLTAVHWWVYEEKDLDIKIDPIWTNKKVHWWITKLNPGQFMPMHTDPHTHDEKCVRYWVPLLDYIPGHIFIYKDKMIDNYKAGDVFEYYQSTDIHGAANISHTPRIILQVTEYVD